MIYLNKKKSGFTLIELMVVISIIGLLASILIASLNTARLKARDAKIRQLVLQMRTLIELDYSETQTFGALQAGWFSSVTQCNTTGASGGTFTGAYAQRARDICAAITPLSTTSNFAGQILYVGNGVDLGSKFSIMAFLPGKQTFYCIGSSGVASDNTISSNAWTQPGCFSNP